MESASVPSSSVCGTAIGAGLRLPSLRFLRHSSAASTLSVGIPCFNSTLTR